jgi:hypothetical protein
MAQVAGSVSQRIDLLLRHASDTWARLPAIEAEIGGWDLLDRIDFVEEWPLEEQKLEELERYAAAGALTPRQRARYEDLQHLVERNRPIIQRLRRGQ